MKEFRISIHLLFIDFKSGHDSNDREWIMKPWVNWTFQRN